MPWGKWKHMSVWRLCTNMSMAVLFAIVPNWKQSSCPLTSYKTFRHPQSSLYSFTINVPSLLIPAMVSITIISLVCSKPSYGKTNKDYAFVYNFFAQFILFLHSCLSSSQCWRPSPCSHSHQGLWMWTWASPCSTLNTRNCQNLTFL